ncbi:Rhodanese-related sulfurtransferase [Halpernia humi]|uniref:Rhodanese-related sulfurtransferase n=1 Tax=Halpernia humi TaxID=493375 RepID=A0A1H5USE0_9FLAO|nr:rhodanese-like domain-containing protein [Halpernia humi]SEF77338.1 Rhodanese-related sulfurtransferase [Halpernia humi]
MKNILAILLLAFLINCNPSTKSSEIESVNATKILKQKLKENPFLVDVRTPEEFAKGSINGAVNIPLDEIPNRISEFKGKKNIVTFCVTGRRSGEAIKILKENGITDVTSGIGVENLKKLEAEK